MFMIVNGPGTCCHLTDLTVWEPNMLHKYRSDGYKPQIPQGVRQVRQDACIVLPDGETQLEVRRR